MSVLRIEVVRQFRLTMPGICLREVGPVRRIVRSHLRLWGKSGLSDLTELGVSELLANVCVHTSGDCELLVRETPDGILVAVTDFDDRLPTPKKPTDDEESGRGLCMLSGLVDELTVEPLPFGKQVRFRLRQPATDTQTEETG